ncbi:hypothetical protein T06_6017 [Trichinella sp. T6]|nr:hypothetical protein T06_6017 [Trichinella sp. T6]
MGKRCCCSVYLEKEEILSDHRAVVMVVVASSSVTLETDCSFAVGRHLASNCYPLKVKNCSVPLTKVQIVVLGCRWVKCVSAGKDPLYSFFPGNLYARLLKFLCESELLSSGNAEFGNTTGDQSTGVEDWALPSLVCIVGYFFCCVRLCMRKINRFKIPGCEKITSKTMQSVQKRRLRSSCITNDVTSGMSRHWTGCWYLNELSHALLLTKSTALP